MAKSNKIARFLKKKAKRTAEKASKPRRNPSTTALTEVGVTVGAGAGAYLANRLGTAVLQKLIGNRLGVFGKHFSPLASLGLATILWYIAEKWASLRRYGTSVLVGSGVAVVQTILSRYLPGIEYLLAPAPPLTLPKATGEYIEDDDDNALPGQQLMTPQLSGASEGVDDILSSTGIFSGDI